jgi:hypothetical protein
MQGGRDDWKASGVNTTKNMEGKRDEKLDEGGCRETKTGKPQVER